MTTKQFHLGLVVTIDDAGTCDFAVEEINGGDESSFAQMEWGEVYNIDSGEWEHAKMAYGHDDATPEEVANFQRLTEVARIAHRLLNGLPERNPLAGVLLGPGKRIG